MYLSSNILLAFYLFGQLKKSFKSLLSSCLWQSVESSITSENRSPSDGKCGFKTHKETKTKWKLTQVRNFFSICINAGTSSVIAKTTIRTSVCINLVDPITKSCKNAILHKPFTEANPFKCSKQLFANQTMKSIVWDYSRNFGYKNFKQRIEVASSVKVGDEIIFIDNLRSALSDQTRYNDSCLRENHLTCLSLRLSAESFKFYRFTISLMKRLSPEDPFSCLALSKDNFINEKTIVW